MPAKNLPSPIDVDGMPVPRRYFAFATIIIGLTLAVLDATVANVALPTIAGNFHVTPAASIEIVSAYQLTIVLLLLPFASLGDIYGYRRVYVAGISVFTLASLACACSNSMLTLTAARVLQGIGAAGIMSVNAALVRYIFPQSEFGRRVALITVAVSVSATIGPSFASLVLGFASWHWLFAVNVPFGLPAIFFAARTLPNSNLSGQKFDFLSAILTAITIGLFVTAIDRLAHGASLAAAATQIILGLFAAFCAIRHQLHRTSPLLPIDLLRIPIFALSICTSICSFCSQMLAYVALPFLLQATMGFKATEVGFLMVPWPLAVGIAAPIAGRLADRHPAAILGLAGLLLNATGLICLALLPAHPGAFNIAWRMGLCGAGFGFFQSPNNRTIITSAPRIRSGAASGMLGTARLLGQATGAALVALVLSHFPLRGADYSLWVAAGFSIAAAGLSFTRRFSRRTSPPVPPGGAQPQPRV
jgi:DHA2 family multidrug resistance protein-like MFS transporter